MGRPRAPIGQASEGLRLCVTTPEPATPFIIIKGGDIMPEILTNIMQVVGSLGFPIVMCILLYNHLNEVQKQHADDLKAEREEHRNEISELKDVINELKVTLVSIRTIIGGNSNASGN